MGWIAERLGPLPGLRLLDVGCGAGLASEWLARKGAVVTGLDAAGAALEAARAHAAAAGLSIDYREGRPEEFAPDEGFDAVISLEVVEHVTPEERGVFCASLARLVRPGGAVVLSTLNRTPRAWMMAKLGAEYLLRWLPVGTHDWRLFPRPSELAALLRAAGLAVEDVAGLTPSLSGGFVVTRDVGVNYMMGARKAA
jgi:2-polyprenyl-6-hydroxyphenyl methylase/3-demethylubiquinone-9 3-methyltransferase